MKHPFNDVCTLIKIVKVYDASNHAIASEERQDIFCSFSNGVVRTEFYEAYKAGIKLTATVEIWKADYAEQSILEYGDKRFNIVRIFPTDSDTLELSCEEVIR